MLQNPLTLLCVAVARNNSWLQPPFKATEDYRNTHRLPSLYWDSLSHHFGVHDYTQ